MFKRLLPIFLLFTKLYLPAQQIQSKILIKGLAVDSLTHQPLSFATVILYDALTKQPIKSLLSKDDGGFEFIVLSQKPSYLTLAYIGYQVKTLKLAISVGESVMDIGIIYMSVSQGQLREVSIIAAKPLLKREIDRISFDVQADPESKANDALEMLRKVPMVTVDANDMIQLKGNSSFRIFINGKPSALMANNPSDVLKAMPAASIKKIEVITVPPSKYDSEGLTGIINIITLQKTDEGFNGSIFGRYNNITGIRSSISLSAKSGNFGLNGLLGLGHLFSQNTAASSQLTTFDPASSLSQLGENLNGGNFNNGQVQMSYEMDSLDLINASMDYINRNLIQNTARFSQFILPPDSLAQSYRLKNLGLNWVGAFDFSINYQRGFKQNKNELLTLSYLYASTNNKQSNGISSTDRFNYTNPDYEQENSTGSKEQTFQLDYVNPIHNLTLEAGAKAILRKNTSDFAESNFDTTSGQYLPDTALTNQFNYRQYVYSLYNSYELKWLGWRFKGGLRIEKTVIRGDYTSSDTFKGQDYLNLIPAISIQRNDEAMGIFSLGFTERIERPGLKQLNPFVDRSNPEFIVTGNPELRPVVNHIFELSYSRFAKISLNAGLNFAFSNNTVQSITSLINGNVSQTTYSNIGQNQVAGINLNMNYHFTDNLDFNMNAQLAHLWITGTYNSLIYKNDGTQGNFSTYLRYKFEHDFNMGANVDYFSGNIYLQGKSSDFFLTSFVFIKDFFERRATLSLTVNNPFKKYNYISSFTKTPDFLQSTDTQNYYRNFRLAFNYKFGKLKGGIKSNKRSIKNDDVKGNGIGNEN